MSCLPAEFTAFDAQRNYAGLKKRGDDRCWFCHECKMTRSHALLHCTNDKLRAARAEAWKGKDPGSIRVLLNNPRWERRLLRFLELSEAGRLVGDEDPGGQAGRVDCVVGGGEGRPVWHHVLFLFLLAVSSFVFPFKRAPSLELCAQRTLGSEDFIVSRLWSSFPFDFCTGLYIT